MKFLNKYGLLKPTSHDIVSENCVLVSMQFVHLFGNSELKLTVMAYLSRSYKDGIYHNFPIDYIGNVSERDKNFSPDQYLAFASVSGHIAKRLWKKTRFSHYAGRYMEAKAYLFCGVMAGKKYLKPLLKIACRISINKFRNDPEKESSGMRKVYLIYKSLGWEIDYDIESQSRAIYFKELDNPLRTGKII